MASYPEVPDWWYLSIFAVMFVAGALAIELWKSQLPIWAYVMALVLSFAYVLPVGIILAVTNQQVCESGLMRKMVLLIAYVQVGLNVITELIIGYALPGRPIAMMMFKTWGYIVCFFDSNCIW